MSKHHAAHALRAAERYEESARLATNPEIAAHYTELAKHEREMAKAHMDALRGKARRPSLAGLVKAVQANPSVLRDVLMFDAVTKSAAAEVQAEWRSDLDEMRATLDGINRAMAETDRGPVRTSEYNAKKSAQAAALKKAEELERTGASFLDPEYRKEYQRMADAERARATTRGA